MTRDVTSDLQRIRLFLTEPHDCSYLPGKKATTAFVDPLFPVDQSVYSQLSGMGFRRSGRYVYTPRCETCNACISVRIHSGGLKLNRQQRRCKKKNTDLTTAIRKDIDFSEHYPLYESYISKRHHDGDMFPPTQEQYSDFIGALWDTSRVVEYRLEDKLIAASVIDILDDGLSAIYTYYSIEYANRSLGTFAILTAAEIAADWGLPYVYLGYWIQECQKMAYKTAFRPIEMFTKGRWTLVN